MLFNKGDMNLIVDTYFCDFSSSNGAVVLCIYDTPFSVVLRGH